VTGLGSLASSSLTSVNFFEVKCYDKKELIKFIVFITPPPLYYYY
jgi:hypothetical protein